LDWCVLEDQAGGAAAFDGVDVVVGIDNGGEAVDGRGGVELGGEGLLGFGHFFECADSGLGGFIAVPGDELVDGETVGRGDLEEAGSGAEEVFEELVGGLDEDGLRGHGGSFRGVV